MSGNKKLQVWLPLLFSLVLILGMLLGYKLGDKQSGGKDFFASNRRNTLQKAIDLIRLRYVDSVGFDTLQGQAIEDLMNELDPHSVYLPPVDLREANEDLASDFDGIGFEFNVFDDTINVTYVISGGPADKAGLQIGDKVIKVNDSLLAGRNLGLNEFKGLMRGPKGSKAVLQILREGKNITLTATRNTIPLQAVDAAYMLDPTTGYIRLDRFSDNSYEDFMAAMETLKKQGMQALVFDLRQNGGGLMDEAVDIVDEFLDGDKLVVYTQGVNSKKREYRCKRPGIFEKGKLVLLVDNFSASASEVVAGALQDWCRAKVIGRRTFGKGLVQEIYPLGDGSAIKLTVARYYTPVGRSIQRSYDKGRKVYMDELYERISHGELFFRDSNRINTGKPFLTVCRDTVYEGGGIMPDIFIGLDTSLLEQQIDKLITTNNLNIFTYRYYLANRNEISAYKSSSDFAQRYDPNDLWNNFHKMGITPKVLLDSQIVLIKQRLKAFLARFRWRTEGFIQVLNTDDPMIKAALQTLKSS